MDPNNHARALIFDLDGTLLDTLEDIAAAANRALADAGHPQHPLSAYRRFVGSGSYHLMRRALPENCRRPEQIEAGLAAFLDHYRQGWDRATRPYPGIRALLRQLQADGRPMSVLSNKPDEFTHRCVTRFLADIPFVQVQGYREGVARKPDPAGALAMANRMGVAPAHCLFVGDSGIDMQTAVRAGMVPVGVLWGFRGPEELTAAGARVLLERPGPIAALCRPAAK